MRPTDDRPGIDAMDNAAAHAALAPAEGHFPPESATPPAAPPRRRWRRLGAALLALALLLAALLAGAWVWMGREGSLATALRWAGARQPLVTDEVTGTLRGGGKVRRLVWQQNGLRVEVQDAELRWTPAALLRRTLRIDRLAAARILIDDHRPRGEPSAGPPASLALPLHIEVKQLQAGELRWVGPPPYTLQDVAGRFDYDGARHLLELDSARIEGGRYRARAVIGAHAPLRLDVELAGALQAPVPSAAQPVPLTLQASLRGPLTALQAQADLQAAAPEPGASAPALAVPALPPLQPVAGAGTPAAPASVPAPAAAAAASSAGAAQVPEAHASARITPWAAQPLPEAHARVRALDLGALWVEAPRTRLTGHVDVTPLPAGGAPGWQVDARLTNADAGPWDERLLPLQQLTANLAWQDRVATVHALRAELGGGTIAASGRWAAPPATASTPAAAPASAPGAPAAVASAAPAAGRWAIDARIDGIDPARLHTQLAAFPLDGTASVQGQGAELDFTLALQARAQAAPRAQARSDAERLARELHALHLQSASASGRWSAGLLRLHALDVRSADARLSGSGELRPGKDAPGGSAQLAFAAPGIAATLKGELQPARGAGTLDVQLRDAAKALAWAQKLPGAGAALAGAQARGSATLQGSWRGGWQDPAVQVAAKAPALSWQAGGNAAGGTQGTEGAAPAEPLQLSDLALALNGRLASAQLTLSGQARQGERRAEWRLAASGGRTTPHAALTQSGWRANLTELSARLQDPALGAGPWQLASQTAVPLSWRPAAGAQRSGQLEAGAGELTLTSPPPVAQARLAWGPVRWRAGQLSTTGRLTGLPLQWLERVAGTQLQEAGVTGDIVFNGDWDASLGQQLRVTANLARASGDLSVLSSDAQTGVQSRVAAGLRDARLTLRSEGRALNLAVVWDSARAGTVNGQLRTELAAARDEAGDTHWSWPEAAPLQGRLQARLPEISAWSVLAPPGWRLRGALSADVRVAGTRSAPLASGSLTADDVALRSVVDGLQFEGGRLRARLDGTRLLIDEFSLRGAGEQASGGTLRASGEAGLVDGRPEARLNATLDHLRASIRPDRQVTVSGSLNTALQGRAVSAEGRLTVDRALIELPDESRPALSDDVIVRGPDGRIRAGKNAPGEVARPTSAAGRQLAQQQANNEARRERASADARAGKTEALQARVNVQVDLGDDFRVRGMGVDTRLKGMLTLAADGPIADAPRLTGRVQTVGGTVRAYSQQLNVQRGNIVFRGAIDNPALDIIALRPNYASDQRVGVQVAGTALLPRVRLYSEPALSDNEALAWLLLGRAAPDTGAEAAMLQSAALALLGGRKGRGLAASVGLDELSFSGGSDGSVANASVTLGKRLSDRLYAAYAHSLAGASGTLMIFYELSRRWTLRGQAGENSAIDLIYRLSFD